MILKDRYTDVLHKRMTVGAYNHFSFLFFFVCIVQWVGFFFFSLYCNLWGKFWKGNGKAINFLAFVVPFITCFIS